MKATAMIDGANGRVEMSIDTGGTFKMADGDMAVLSKLADETRQSYMQLKDKKHCDLKND